jgi:hypothetical protein
MNDLHAFGHSRSGVTALFKKSEAQLTGLVRIGIAYSPFLEQYVKAAERCNWRQCPRKVWLASSFRIEGALVKVL